MPDTASNAPAPPARPYVDPVFRSPLQRHGDNNAYAFGRWAGDTVMPGIGGPMYRATQPAGGVPGWLNGMLTYGAGGAVAGGLWNKYVRGGDFGTGAAWGGLGGGLGGLAAGHVLSGSDWAQRLPLVGGFLASKDTVPQGGNIPTTATGVPLGKQTYDQIKESLPALDGQQTKTSSTALVKQGGAWGSGEGGTDQVLKKIYMDTALTLMQKQELSNQVRYLDANQARRLNQLLSGAIGSGVGLLVAKYLLGMGKFSTILSTIIGGVMGLGMGSGSAPKPTHDKYGRPYYL